MTKKCLACGEIKSVDSFNQKTDKKDGRISKCKECHHKYIKDRYTKDSKPYIQRAVNARKELREFFQSSKDNKPCADCGAVHRHFALDYDHRDPSQKVLGVARLINRGSREKIIKEIAKCDLICATCHRYRTFGQRRHSDKG